MAVAEPEPFLEPEEPGDTDSSRAPGAEPEPQAAESGAAESGAAESGAEPQRYLEPEPELEVEPEPEQEAEAEAEAEARVEPGAWPPAAAHPITPSGAFLPGAAFAAAAPAPEATASPAPVAPGARPEPGPPAGARLSDAQAAAAARWANVVTDPGPVPVAVPAPPATTSSRPSIPALPVLVLERGVTIAAGIIAVTFLLPWGDLMIGAALVGDPWQGLGIVGSWHWLAWLLALPVILLASSVPAVPAWLRLGVLPIAYAGLVIGLAWPYVLGPIGGAPAPMVLVFAAGALVVLGALAVRPGGIEEGPGSS